jgi:hypothetical protein
LFVVLLCSQVRACKELTCSLHVLTCFYPRLSYPSKTKQKINAGMEDQLQALVPESIQDYLAADVKVWMITGDKLEAAKTIGIACNLVDPDMLPAVRAGDRLADVARSYTAARLLVRLAAND